MLVLGTFTLSGRRGDDTPFERTSKFVDAHYGNARQLQRVRDLACANGRAHDGSKEDLYADGSIGQAVTVRRELTLELCGARSVLGVLRSPMEEARPQSGHPYT